MIPGEPSGMVETPVHEREHGGCQLRRMTAIFPRPCEPSGSLTTKR